MPERSTATARRVSAKAAPSNGHTLPAGDDARGVFMRVKKEDLKLDLRYQRTPNAALVKRLVEKWDWRQAGTLSVSLRQDGTSCIFDGGHRHAAAMLRPDITDLDCMVYASDGQEDVGEATRFIHMNTDRRKVTAYDLFHASLFAGDAVAKQVQALLTRHGYHASRAKGPAAVCAINDLTIMVKTDAALADKVVELLAEVDQRQSTLPGILLRGLFDLCQRLQQKGLRLPTETPWRTVFVEATLGGMMTRYRGMMHSLNRGGVEVCGIALRNLANSARRRKLAEVY